MSSSVNLFITAPTNHHRAYFFTSECTETVWRQNSALPALTLKGWRRSGKGKKRKGREGGMKEGWWTSPILRCGCAPLVPMWCEVALCVGICLLVRLKVKRELLWSHQNLSVLYYWSAGDNHCWTYTQLTAASSYIWISLFVFSVGYCCILRATLRVFFLREL